VFRALLEADAAMAAGDAATAISRLEPRLSDLEAREAVLIRLLAAWRAGGRLAEGRWRIENLATQRPADPVPADALFAIDRALNGPRATAIDLRPQAGSAISGHPRRRLELVLTDIPESAAEARRISIDRLDRRPSGPAGDIQRLAILRDSGGDDGPSLDAALSTIEARDIESLSPRLRRRLASVAAAIPDRRGEAVVTRIAEAIPSGRSVDVDTAIAIALTLDPDVAREQLAGRPLEAPWTRLDPTWRSRLAPLAAREAEVADAVAVLGLETPADAARDPGFLRTAIAISMLAGVDGGTLLDRMDRAAGIGWDPAAAWPDGDDDDLRRLAAVASDATMLGREDLSIELMERAVDARPDDPVLLNNLGYALLERGRVDDAAALLERSREIDPDSASTLDSMGWLRFQQGRHDAADPESAIALIRRSLAVRIAEGRAPSAEVLLHLADASWAAGDRDTAQDVWRRIAAPVSDVDRARRLEGIRSYQVEVWGGELVPSEAIDHLLEGRWSERAIQRLQAIRAGRPPLGEVDIRPPSDA
jgi:tetratricopeptide (TPR) repeat protein